jgi:hypothetical protein
LLATYLVQYDWLRKSRFMVQCRRRLVLESNEAWQRMRMENLDVPDEPTLVNLRAPAATSVLAYLGLMQLGPDADPALANDLYAQLGIAEVKSLDVPPEVAQGVAPGVAPPSPLPLYETDVTEEEARGVAAPLLQPGLGLGGQAGAPPEPPVESKRRPGALRIVPLSHPADEKYMVGHCVGQSLGH